MFNKDFFKNEGLLDTQEFKEEEKYNFLFDLLYNKSLKNIFLLSEILNVKNFES